MDDNPYHTPMYHYQQENVPTKLLLRLDVPIKTVSEANSREHWLKSAKRHTAQQWAIKAIWPKNEQISLPCWVCLERLSERRLDSDNLAMAFKWIRDQIADQIIPDKAKGQADADPRIEWVYRQSKSKIQGIRITIWGYP